MCSESAQWMLAIAYHDKSFMLCARARELQASACLFICMAAEIDQMLKISSVSCLFLVLAYADSTVLYLSL